jgi:hypothetical protein
MLRRVALVRSDLLKELVLLQGPHDVKSQKTAFVIVTAVKISSLKIYIFQMHLNFLARLSFSVS